MKILIELKTLVTGATEDEQSNVDWRFVKESKYSKAKENSFREQAKKISLKPDVYEVHIVAQGEGDPEIQEFWRDGKLHFKMF